MTSPKQTRASPSRLRFALGAMVLAALQRVRNGGRAGVVQGVQKGAREGNKAAGPVGGVLGGAIGGVVGVVGRRHRRGDRRQQQGEQAPAAKDSKQGEAPSRSQTGRASKQGDARSPRREPRAPRVPRRTQATGRDLTQTGAPQLTAEQIVANSDANIERIKKELNLTPEQEKNWAGFNSAMHYLGHNGADRLNLRIARAKRDPPDDIIEQMRNEAQFLNDRAVDQRNVADAAEPLFASLDDKQKAIFIQEMVNLEPRARAGLRLPIENATAAGANSRAPCPGVG